jgi:hypothetical protein
MTSQDETYIASCITALPLIKKRCSRGHEWESTNGWKPFSDSFSIDYYGPQYCMRCIKEFLDANIGVVK